jgi:predicted transposase/invertase (TIGR01784 family)
LNKATEYEKDTIPKELNEPEIIQAFNTIEKMNLKTKEREYYEAAKKVMRDEAAQLLTAIENAVDNRNIEIAKSLKENGANYELIIKSTGLTKDQIDKL